MNKIELQKHTLKQLKEIAKEKLGKGYSKFKKTDLINKLCDIACCHGQDDPLCSKCEEPPLKEVKKEIKIEPLKEVKIEVKIEPLKEVKKVKREPVKKNSYSSNRWIKHLKSFRKTNPNIKGLSNQILEAKKIYILNRK